MVVRQLLNAIFCFRERNERRQDNEEEKKGIEREVSLIAQKDDPGMRMPREPTETRSCTCDGTNLQADLSPSRKDCCYNTAEWGCVDALRS